jgi:hypothetical protein
MSSKIRFQPNEPQTFKLIDPYADSCELYDAERGVGEYRTTDGRILALPRPAVLKLNELEPAVGEAVSICRYDRNHSKGAEWAVWLTVSSEKARSEAEEPSELAAQLAASLEQGRNGKPPKDAVTVIRRKPAAKQDTTSAGRFPDESQPRLFDRGTGTDGPAPQRIPLPAASAPTRRDRPMPIPWNIAFREVSAWVSKELASNSLQWSDQAQQAMVCTVLIAEAKAGRVTVWERAE